MALLPIIAIFFADGAAAQPQPSAPGPKKRPQAIQEIVDAAAGAPAELGSHLLLRLVETGLVKDREWRTELLERAFRMAAGAKHPFGIAGLVGAARSTDSDIGVLAAALDPGLDQLSLRSRAVRQLLDTNPKAARGLFAEIPHPDPPALTCKDGFGYRLGVYYTTAGALFERAFSAQDLAQGRHLVFLEEVIRGIRSPFELEPVIPLVIQAKLSPEERARLLEAYSAVLKDLSADPRSLSLTVNHSLLEGWTELAARFRHQGIDVFGFADACRTLLARYASGTLCREQIDPKSREAAIPALIGEFNEKFRKIAGPAGEALAPIDTEEIRPAKIEGGAQCYEYWQKPATRELLSELKRLRFGLTEAQRKQVSARLPQDHIAPYLNQAERSTPEWEAEVRVFLNKLEDWKKDHDERDVDFFHQVEITYFALTDLVPPGPLLDRVLDSAFAHLAQSMVETEDPPQWFLHVDEKLQRKQNRVRIKAEALRSGDAVIAAFVALRELTESGHPQP